MLSRQVKEALEGEREHLRKYVSKAQDRIAAIDTLLESDDTMPLFSHLFEQDAPPSGNGSLAGKGFAEAIFIVLGSYPRGLTQGELEEKLVSKGMTVSGKLPLRTRLRAEVWRQKKSGKLTMKGKRVLIKPKEEIGILGG